MTLKKNPPEGPSMAKVTPKCSKRRPKMTPRRRLLQPSAAMERCCRNISIYDGSATLSGSQVHLFSHICCLKTRPAHRTPTNHNKTDMFSLFCEIVSILGSRPGGGNSLFRFCSPPGLLLGLPGPNMAPGCCPGSPRTCQMLVPPPPYA